MIACFAILSLLIGSVQDKTQLDEAFAHYQHGRTAEAQDAYTKLLDDPKVGSSAALGLSLCLTNEGNDLESLKVVETALEKEPKSVRLLARHAELLIGLGKETEAEDSLAKGLKLDPESLHLHLVRAQLLQESGSIKEALAEYRWFVRYYNRAQPADPESLMLVARGSAQYARWQRVSSIFGFVINTLCPDALKADPDYWQAYLISGELLLEKYNKPQGLPDLQKALAINPRCVEAHAAMARAALNDYQLDEAAVSAREALRINPRSVDALLVLADIHLQEGETKLAAPYITRALEARPHSQQALARQAALFILDDPPLTATEWNELLEATTKIDQLKNPPTTRFGKLFVELTRRNPHPGYFLHTLGEQLETSRKFDLAESCYRAAESCMPELSEPKTALGMLYLRIGRADLAKPILDSAFKADPFHVRVSNLRKVIKTLESYEAIETDHFVVRVNGASDLVFGLYLSEYLEEVYPELVGLYQFEPSTRTQFEIYYDGGGQTAHEWFSARMVGLPWIQTIGASTGMLVAMTSPTALEKPFNWARVVKHEFVHVITLQQTNFNIPHWYTEALAVDVEGRTPQDWNSLIRSRVARNDLWPINRLTAGFIRPNSAEDWSWAYCQSHLCARYLIERGGNEAIAKLLNAYQRNLATEDAIAEILGIPYLEFEKGFHESIRKRAAELKVAPPDPEGEPSIFEQRLASDPNNADLMGELAWVLLKAEQGKAARDKADEALKLNPKAAWAALTVARIEINVDNLDQAIAVLEAAEDPEKPHFEILRALGTFYLQKEEYEKSQLQFAIGRRLYADEVEWAIGYCRATFKLPVEKQGGLDEALMEWASLAEDDVTPRKQLMLRAAARGDHPEVKKWAKSVIEIDVEDVETHTVLAKSARETKDLKLAIREQKALTLLVTDSKEPHLALIELLHESGQEERAKASLLEYEKKFPNDPEGAALKQKLGL